MTGLKVKLSRSQKHRVQNSGEEFNQEPGRPEKTDNSSNHGSFQSDLSEGKVLQPSLHREQRSDEKPRRGRL